MVALEVIFLAMLSCFVHFGHFFFYGLAQHFQEIQKEEQYLKKALPNCLV